MDSRIAEVLGELYNYNLKLIPYLQKIVSSLRIQREDQAVSMFVNVIEGLQWVMDVVLNTKDALEGCGIRIDEEKMNGILRELMETLENRDYVLMADLLEYEMLEVLQGWQAGLEKVAGTAGPD